MLVPVTGVTKAIADLQARNPDAADMLAQLGLYEALCDEVDRIRPVIEKRAREEIISKAAEARRGLVRAFISKRLAGEDVTEILKAAAHQTLLEDVAKTTAGEHDDPNTPYYDARGAGGRFVAALDRFVRPSQGADRRSYRQAAVIGEGLQSKHPAAGMLATAGNLGPEAERVLSPGLRRTAYRYRGTERTPDEGLQAEVGDLARVTQATAAGEPLHPDAEQLRTRYLRELSVQETANAPGKPPRRVPASPEAGAFGHSLRMAQHEKHTPDQARMNAVADHLTVELRDQIPDVDLARISRHAGQLPPSIGYMVDADGDVVSHAQGFNGDHYLPFDLSNLKRLHGGQYVRTRTSGGPTDEDIYTGLMTGTRQLTVESNSGVFTVEFDPDLRGGRRYSDKARQMVDRYSRLVSSIGSGQLWQRPPSPEQQRAMRQEAIEEAGEGNWTRAKELLEEKQKSFVEQQKFDFPDDDELRHQAKEEANAAWKMGQKGNKPTQSRQSAAKIAEDRFHELKAERDTQIARIYQLDGEGYEAALKALQQEFPFFIRNTRFETWPEFMESRRQASDGRLMRDRQPDLGYTRRNSLHAVGVPDYRAEAVKRPETTTTSATGEAEATADTGTSTGAGTAGATAPAANALVAEAAKPGSPVVRELGDNLAATLFQWNKSWGPLFENAGMTLPYEADGNTPVIPDHMEAGRAIGGVSWVAAMTKEKPNAGQAAAHLMAPGTPIENLETAKRTLEALRDKGRPEPAEKTKIDDAIASVDKAILMRRPWAEPDPDPGSAVPGDPALPQPFPDIASLTKPEEFDKLFKQDGKIQQGIKELGTTDPSDPAIAAKIKQQAQWHRDMAEWGGRDGGKPSEANRPDHLDGEDPKLAKELNFQGDKHQMHKDLLAQQRAWSFLQGRKMVYLSRGQTPPPLVGGDADPKDPPQVGFIVAKGAGRRVPVFPADHPVAKALARRRDLVRS